MEDCSESPALKLLTRQVRTEKNLKRAIQTKNEDKVFLACGKLWQHYEDAFNETNGGMCYHRRFPTEFLSPEIQELFFSARGCFAKIREVVREIIALGNK